MKSNISPEERLLRLIRGNKKDEAKTKAPAVAAVNTSFQGQSAVFYLRKLLLSVFVIACIYLAAAFIYPWVAPKEIKLPEVTQEAVLEPEKGLKAEIKPVETYLAGIKSRQIFSSVSAPESGRPAENKNLNADLIRELNLIGIIAGDNPQAVIEDKMTQKTYYLNKGQSFGEFQVEDITDGKVILNSQGKKFELYM